MGDVEEAQETSDHDGTEMLLMMTKCVRRRRPSDGDVRLDGKEDEKVTWVRTSLMNGDRDFEVGGRIA